MTIVKDAIEVANMEDSGSEDSEDFADAMKIHVEAAIDAPQTQAPESIWERQFTLLEEEVSVIIFKEKFVGFGESPPKRVDSPLSDTD
ncbi:hypothetical protein HAX54_052507 [Datura stramonium]|uniref:Uncharacterized protein n=1 Tax=Datura stramonium TaxID=4076 RepID=A0ABS8T0W2_DATST|nr:hypothetical protein [Datura stramonium]